MPQRSFYAIPFRQTWMRHTFVTRPLQASFITELAPTS